jgi:small GTP-binding protein
MDETKQIIANADGFNLRIVAARLPDSFNSVAFSPDGKLFACGSSDRTVKLFDMETGSQVRLLEGHLGSVSSVAFSPDGRLLVSGSTDRTVRLWDVKTGEQIRSLEGHQDTVFSVAFSPNGQRLASGSSDRTVRIWDVEMEGGIRTLRGHSGSVRSVVFRVEGRYLASGSDDHTVRLWEVETGKQIRSFDGHKNSTRSVVFSPGGRTLASGSTDSTVRLWDVDTGKLICSLEGHQQAVNSVAFTAYGRILASGSDDRTVKLWDIRDREQISSLEGHSGGISSVGFAPNDSFLASCSSDCTVRLWEIKAGKQIRSLEGHKYGVRVAAISPDGRMLASGSDDRTVKLWEVETGKQTRLLEGHLGLIRSIGFSPDGRMLASGSDDRTVKLWEVETGKQTRSFEGHLEVVRSIEFSPDGRMLASGSDDRTVKLWEVETGKLLRSLEDHRGLVSSVAFSPDGRMLASGSADCTVKLWEVRTGEQIRSFEAHLDWIRSAALSSDGRTLASGSDDRTVKLWEVETGKLLRSLEGHLGLVSSVAFSPDDRMLASGSDDRTVKLWEVGTGAGSPPFELIPLTHELLTVAFRPPLKRAASFGQTKFGDADIITRLIDPRLKSIVSDIPLSSYISAKVALIGDSGVGKSCLALRLTKNEYNGEMETTHGMRTWKISPEQLDPDASSLLGEEREIFIWDFGGQEEYRLVNQLFLPETTLAMILFDPTRGQTAFDDVCEWELRLRKQTERSSDDQKVVKLLVGTKLDRGDEVVDRAEINRLLEERGLVGYFETSALTSRGVPELGKTIVSQIDWDDLSRTNRPRLFQMIRETVRQMQDKGEATMLLTDLEKEIRALTKDEGLDAEFDLQAVNTVIKQLSAQGAIVDTRLSTGERVLVLQIGFISIYAGSLILAARDNPRGVPALEESKVISGEVPLPRVKSGERLPANQERIVLNCIVQLLLDRGLCFKHEGLLIFPTKFKQMAVEHGAQAAHMRSLYYDFSGAIDNIYASLVTQLAMTGDSRDGFGRVRLWEDRAEYEAPGRGVCALRKVNRKSGLAHLDLLFSEKTSPETRDLFSVFVEEHLRKEGVNIREVLEMVCPCGYRFAETDVRERINDNQRDIGCVKCDRRLLISEGSRKTRAAVELELFALKTRIEEKKREGIAEVKEGFKPIEVFISYSHTDESLCNELIKHLKPLERENIIGPWHDRKIGAGSEWKGEIDQHLESAGIILLLVSPDFMASDYCYDIEMKRALERRDKGEAAVIPIALRPVDWLNAPLAGLQSLPRDNKAVASSHWKYSDEAFLEVAKGIRQAADEILRPRSEAATGAAPQFLSRRIQLPPTRILHLSDLHFTASDDPFIRLQPLISDLTDRSKDGLGVDKLDYLVISGDLTDRGAHKEYEQVHRFLTELIDQFELSAERTIIVPGNHDLSWDVEVYYWLQVRKVDVATLAAGSYVKQGNGYLVRDDARYARRFGNFARFYHEFKQLEYPLAPESQCLPVLFEETGIQFMAMNSAWLIDEFHPDRSIISEAGLTKGLMEADRQIRDARRDNRLAANAPILRIAVWHHQVAGDEKIADDSFIKRLCHADFKLCLHGHVHDDKNYLIGYTHPAHGIHIAGAGSFGAETAHRPPSAPRLYNLIEIPRDHSLISIRSRRMSEDGSVWRSWPDDSGKEYTLRDRAGFELKRNLWSDEEDQEEKEDADVSDDQDQEI